MKPEDVKTMQQLIDYCRGVLTHYSEHPKDDELKAGAGELISLLASPYYDKLKEECLIIEEIIDIASDLDWSNTLSPIGDWNHIRNLVNELSVQFNDKKYK